MNRTTKYKHYWNILKERELVLVELDIEHKVSEWRLRHNFFTDETKYHEISLAQIKKEVNDAMRINQEIRKMEKVNEAVSDEGPEAMPVRWVLTLKIVDCEKPIKPRLVDIRFEHTRKTSFAFYLQFL